MCFRLHLARHSFFLHSFLLVMPMHFIAQELWRRDFPACPAQREQTSCGVRFPPVCRCLRVCVCDVSTLDVVSRWTTKFQPLLPSVGLLGWSLQQ